MNIKETVKKELKTLGIRPDKAYGQNFICTPSAIDEIINFGRPKADENIVEIGPGLGVLTNELLSINDITVVEIEEKFCSHLSTKYPRLTVLNEDIRFFDLTTLGEELTVFGNLPYSFSSQILFYLLSYYKNINRAVLLLQKEFAERVASPPDVKAYGRLSVRAQLLAKPKLGPILPGNVFHPEASVESRVLELRFYDEPLFPVHEESSFKQLLSVSFSQRRRKLFNSLFSSGIYDRALLEDCFNKFSLDENVRAENLSVEMFTKLSNYLSDKKPSV